MSIHWVFLSLTLLSQKIAPSLFDHLWQSSIFACVVCVLVLCLRSYQARVRYWLWLAAAVKFLIPFSLFIGLGAHLNGGSQTKTGPYPAFDGAIQPFAEMSVRGSSINDVHVTSAASHPWITFLPAVLAVLWLCGFIWMLVFWSMQWRRLAVMKRRAVPLSGGREIEVLRRLERAFGRSKSVEVSLLSESIEPGVAGVIHPILIWPVGMSRHLTDAQLEAILAHELCHLKRHDNQTSIIQMLVETLFWFHPLVWWIGKKLVDERERACDEDVLLRSEPKVYAEGILKVCEFCVGTSSMCLSGITGADLKNRIGRIMSNGFRSRLGCAGSLLLGTLAFAALAGPVAFGLMRGTIRVYGQILHASGPLPSYEVATIKPLQPGQPLPGIDQRSNVRTTVGSIKQLIGLAYNLPPLSVVQIVGAPEWVGKDQYVVQTQVEDSMNARLEKMSPAEALTQRELLLQSLLADRLKLKVHFETRDLPMYAMVVAKGGPKLHPTKEIPAETDMPLPPPPAPGASPSLAGLRKGFIAFPKGATFEMQAKALTLDELAEMLQRQPDAGGHLVVNQTGIAGLFDCTMKWTHEFSATASGHELPPDSDEPPFFTAIREQIGLRLIPTKGPAEVIVIDHIERPSEN